MEGLFGIGVAVGAASQVNALLANVSKISSRVFAEHQDVMRYKDCQLIRFCDGLEQSAHLTHYMVVFCRCRCPACRYSGAYVAYFGSLETLIAMKKHFAETHHFNGAAPDHSVTSVTRMLMSCRRLTRGEASRINMGFQSCPPEIVRSLGDRGNLIRECGTVVQMFAHMTGLFDYTWGLDGSQDSGSPGGFFVPPTQHIMAERNAKFYHFRAPDGIDYFVPKKAFRQVVDDSGFNDKPEFSALTAHADGYVHVAGGLWLDFHRRVEEEAESDIEGDEIKDEGMQATVTDTTVEDALSLDHGAVAEGRKNEQPIQHPRQPQLANKDNAVIDAEPVTIVQDHPTRVWNKEYQSFVVSNQITAVPVVRKAVRDQINVIYPADHPANLMLTAEQRYQDMKISTKLKPKVENALARMFKFVGNDIIARRVDVNDYLVQVTGTDPAQYIPGKMNVAEYLDRLDKISRKSGSMWVKMRESIRVGGGKRTEEELFYGEHYDLYLARKLGLKMGDHDVFSKKEPEDSSAARFRFIVQQPLSAAAECGIGKLTGIMLKDKFPFMTVKEGAKHYCMLRIAAMERHMIVRAVADKRPNLLVSVEIDMSSYDASIGNKKSLELNCIMKPLAKTLTDHLSTAQKDALTLSLLGRAEEIAKLKAEVKTDRIKRRFGVVLSFVFHLQRWSGEIMTSNGNFLIQLCCVLYALDPTLAYFASNRKALLACLANRREIRGAKCLEFGTSVLGADMYINWEVPCVERVKQKRTKGGFSEQKKITKRTITINMAMEGDDNKALLLFNESWNKNESPDTFLAYFRDEMEKALTLKTKLKLNAVRRHPQFANTKMVPKDFDHEFAGYTFGYADGALVNLHPTLERLRSKLCYVVGNRNHEEAMAVTALRAHSYACAFAGSPIEADFAALRDAAATIGRAHKFNQNTLPHLYAECDLLLSGIELDKLNSKDLIGKAVSNAETAYGLMDISAGKLAAAREFLKIVTENLMSEDEFNVIC